MTRPRFSPPRRRPAPAAAVPRWLRPKLAAGTQELLSLAQHVNVDAIASGTADVTLLHEWADGVLMFSRIAEQLQRGIPETVEQMRLVERVVYHYGATKRIEFPTPQDLELARDGLVVFELLAAECDDQTGLDAATWSARMRERVEASREKAAAR